MEATGSTSSQVTISLSGSEALVLADALDRLDSDDIAAAGPAAERVLADLIAALERLIDVAFSDDFAAHLERARADVLRS